MASATNPAKQRDARGYQTFFDPHGRRWGVVMDRNCKGGPAPVGAFEYVEHLQSDTRFPHLPPWLPEQAWFKIGDANGLGWNQIKIDYEAMAKDQRRAHTEYRNNCLTVAQDLNEDYEPGQMPSAKIRRVVGPPPKPVEPILAAAQGNPWVLGKTDVPHARLKDILFPRVVVEDEDWLSGEDFREEEYPKHLGGPNWQLSDGTRLQGKKEDAVKAQASLAVAA